MEDIIFKMNMELDKNSKEFDFLLLEKLKSLENIHPDKFDTTIRQIMKSKSSCKLWIDNGEKEEWNGTEYRKVNYRCCPASHRARHFFCLVLDKKENRITVTDGFLSAV